MQTDQKENDIWWWKHYIFVRERLLLNTGQTYYLEHESVIKFKKIIFRSFKGGKGYPSIQIRQQDSDN